MPRITGYIVSLALLGVASVVGPVEAQTSAAPIEKTYTVAFEETPWTEVFEWFSRESGLTFIDTVKPLGTLTMRSDAKFTLPIVLDLLNGALELQGLEILRRSQTFLVHPVDEPLPDMVAIITLDELPSRSDRERVLIILPLNTVVAEDMEPLVKGHLSKVGSVSTFGSDQIIVHDKAKHIREIVKLINSYSTPPATPCCLSQRIAAPSVSHPLPARIFPDLPRRWTGKGDRHVYD